MACTGQSLEQIRAEWDIPTLDAWYEYEAAHPPTHLLVAAFMQAEPRPRVKFGEQQPGDAGPDLMAMLSGMPGAAQVG